MKEYLKMSDYIIGEVSMSMNHNCDVTVSYDYADPNMVARKTMDAMEHAINSHDELVAEVGRLRESLSELMDWTLKNTNVDDCPPYNAAYRLLNR